jgi:hypothetical protein
MILPWILGRDRSPLGGRHASPQTATAAPLDPRKLESCDVYAYFDGGAKMQAPADAQTLVEWLGVNTSATTPVGAPFTPESRIMWGR